MDHQIADVRTVVLSENRLLSRCQINARQSGGVAPATIDHVEDVTRLVEIDRMRRQGIRHRNLRERLPSVGTVGFHDLLPAVGRGTDSQADVEIVVRKIPGELIVLANDRSFTRTNIDAIDIMELRVAIVDADEDFAGELVTDFLNLRRDLIDRRQVDRLAGAYVDAVGTPILISALVLQIDDVLVRIRPEIATDTALRVVGHRMGLAGIV